jgi:hypothetical protein
MKYTTKYDIGNKVYRLIYVYTKDYSGEEIRESEITGIGIYQNKQNKIRENYYTDTQSGAVNMEDLFATREEAEKFLQDKIRRLTEME